MIKNKEIKDDVIYIEIAGMVTKKDVDEVKDDVDKVIKEFGKVKIAINMDAFEGYTVDGLIADFSMYFKYKDHMGNLALIGDKSHVKEIFLLCDKFCPNMCQLFDKTNLDKAIHWLKQV